MMSWLETIPPSYPAALLGSLLAVLVGFILFLRRLDRSDWWAWAETQRRRLAGSPVLQSLRGHWPRLWRLIGARLSAGKYLSLHLLLGLGLSLVALGGFGLLASQVVGTSRVTRVDTALATTLHVGATPNGILAFKAITLLGSAPVLLVIGLIVAAVLLQRGQRLRLAGWLIALNGGMLLNVVLKAVFQRSRPEWEAAIAVAGGWSFPSGHAMGSLVAYGMLAYLVLLVVRRPVLRVAVVLALATLVLLIGFSRLYLGVHYLSDVVAGYAAGMVWLAACMSGIEVARWRKRRQQSDNTASKHLEHP